MGARTRGAALAVAVGLALAACGSGGGTGTGGGTAQHPTVVQFWGWNQTLQKQVDVFNATHDTIKLKFVRYPGNPDTRTALNNAQQAKQDVPCLAQSPDTAIRAQFDGLASPIGQYLAPYRDKFTPAAIDAVSLAGESFGVPLTANPTFLMYNKAVYDAKGLTVPKTWDDLIAQGRALRPSGVDVTNLAGEDPSYMAMLMQQAGAVWFAVDGDAWKVAIDTPESRSAARILQQLVDEDLVSNQSFTDLAAMSQYFDQGKMINLPLSTWQLSAWQTRLTKSLGQWAVAPLPAMPGSAVTSTPGVFGALIVPAGCTDPGAATAAAVALTTDPEQIKISADPTKGSGSFPVVPSAADYIPQLIPPTLLGEDKAQASAVIKQVSENTAVIGQDAPSGAVTNRIAELWAQALTKKITFDQMLTTLQTDSVALLRQQGINVR